MGMDVIGVNATTEKGKYFRNNVWWWRPLADYILSEHWEIASHCEPDYWHSNSGGGLDAEKSALLANALRYDIANGRVAEYEKKYREMLVELPREHCDLCEGTGIRTDKVGEGLGMPTQKLEPEWATLTGRTHGTCNACNGVGTKENWLMSYPFTVENVAEFAEFLADCGGFQIH